MTDHGMRIPLIRSSPVRLALATFGILALELALIRWAAQQIRVFAYFNNLVLMASFLGMGLGVGLGRRSRKLFDLTLPSLLILAALLCYAEDLGLTFLSFPDPTVAMWGAEGLKTDETFIGNVAILLGLFSFIVWIFLCAGTLVGELFGEMQSLRAYSYDLQGSLLGVIALAALAWLNTSPPWWLAVAALPFLILSPRWLTFFSFGGVIVLAALSIDGGRFSPYYRIDLTAHSRGLRSFRLLVNRDTHQIAVDLSENNFRRPELTSRDRLRLEGMTRIYELPFRLSDRRGRSLILGAGTGNDVAAALRQGFDQVTAVEIDPMILDLGREHHPERPYSNPRVTAIVNDARQFLGASDEREFDAVCFGLLDSHTMFSSMSSLRLDNYVYTVEALRAAWQRLRPGGVLSVRFAIFKQTFIADRIMKTLSIATGQTPVEVEFGGASSRMFLVKNGSSGADLEKLIDETIVRRSLPEIRPATDDWPFLYIRPDVVPRGYIVIIAGVLLLTALAATLVFGPTLFKHKRFDLPMFLIGVAFLLIETRSVTDLSLLFGSTWIVNASVFAGILGVAWLANLYVARQPAISPAWIFAGLALTIVLGYAIRPGTLSAIPSPWAETAGTVLNALPIGFAGLLFSFLLGRATDPAASLGSNLLGAIVGGCIEYLSMAFGLKTLLIGALVAYAVAFLIAARAGRFRQDPTSSTAGFTGH